MSLSRKHYESIAEAIRKSRLTVHLPDAEASRARIAVCLADYFERDNPNFDRRRFMEACDIPTDQEGL